MFLSLEIINLKWASKRYNNKSQREMRCMQRNIIYVWISEMLRERINSRGDDQQQIEGERKK